MTVEEAIEQLKTMPPQYQLCAADESLDDFYPNPVWRIVRNEQEKQVVMEMEYAHETKTKKVHVPA